MRIITVRRMYLPYCSDMTIVDLSEVTTADLDLLSHVTQEALFASFLALKLESPAFLESINDAANRAVGRDTEKKAAFVAGATAVAGLMMWHSAVLDIESLTTSSDDPNEQLELF